MIFGGLVVIDIFPRDLESAKVATKMQDLLSFVVLKTQRLDGGHSDELTTENAFQFQRKRSLKGRNLLLSS